MVSNDVGDLPFVAPEHDALGQGVGDDQQPFQRKFPNQNRSAHGNRFFGFLRHLDLRPLFLGRRDQAEGSGAQFLEKLRLLVGGQADEHGNAVAEQHRQSICADAHGQRRARQHLALEAGRIDAVAEQQGVRGELKGSWI